MKTLLVSAFLASTALSLPAKADQPTICIVAQATLDQSNALKSIISQLEKKRAEVQKELTADENKLKVEDKKLSEQQGKLSEKEFTEKRREFETRVREVQQKLEIRRIQMEVAFEDAKKKVYEAFLKVANEVKTEMGANIMLYKETVVTADDAFDVSNKVLEKLNSILPTVLVAFKSENDVKNLIQQQQQAPQP